MFCSRQIPELCEKYPFARFVLVGEDRALPDGSTLGGRFRAGTERLPPFDRVIFTGEVSRRAAWRDASPAMRHLRRAVALRIVRSRISRSDDVRQAVVSAARRLWRSTVFDRGRRHRVACRAGRCSSRSQRQSVCCSKMPQASRAWASRARAISQLLAGSAYGSNAQVLSRDDRPKNRTFESRKPRPAQCLRTEAHAGGARYAIKQ